MLLDSEDEALQLKVDANQKMYNNNAISIIDNKHKKGKEMVGNLNISQANEEAFSSSEESSNFSE